jgi:hypothetical protein
LKAAYIHYAGSARNVFSVMTSYMFICANGTRNASFANGMKYEINTFKIMRPSYDLFDCIDIDASSDSLVRNNILIKGILHVQNLLVKLKNSLCLDLRSISKRIKLKYMVQK